MQESSTDFTGNAARALDARRASWRASFSQAANERTAEFAQRGPLGNAAHQQEMHRLCAEELHRRSVMTVDALLSQHKKLSESPREAIAEACKTWLAARIAEEAEELQGFLVRPTTPFGKSGAHETLNDSRNAEIQNAAAHVDSYMNQLQRETTERGIRRVTRVLAWVRKTLRLP